MSDLPLADTSFEVLCPHCKKQFEAEPLLGAAPRYRGFKCPHCRLFVPWEHAAASQLAGTAE